MGEIRRIGGHPQTLDKGASPLCTLLICHSRGSGNPARRVGCAHQNRFARRVEQRETRRDQEWHVSAVVLHCSFARCVSQDWFSTPLVPHSWGRIRGIGGHPPNPRHPPEADCPSALSPGRCVRALLTTQLSPEIDSSLRSSQKHRCMVLNQTLRRSPRTSTPNNRQCTTGRQHFKPSNAGMEYHNIL
jgi:hypothetical protein